MKKRLLVLGSVLALATLAFAFQDQAQGLLLACFGADYCPLGQGSELCCDPVSGPPAPSK